MKRDQAASAFASILADLIRRVPGASAAVLVDLEGEAVDYWGTADPFDLRIAAAHLQLELGHVMRLGLGRVRTLMIRCARKSFVVRALHDDYALLVVLGTRAGFTVSKRAFAACERALYEEAGWPLDGPDSTGAPGPGEPELWYAVEVVRDRRGRPARLRWPSGHSSAPPPASGRHRGTALEVLGSVAGLEPRERGYRVRLPSGKEVTLIRETGGFWYADEPLDGVMTRAHVRHD